MMPTAALEWMVELDKKHTNWSMLPDDHPDIIKLRELNPYFAPKRLCNKPLEWSDRQDAFIRNNYLTMSDTSMATRIQREAGQVARRRTQLGLVGKSRAGRPVIKYDLEGNELQRYTSAKVAAAELKTDRGSINRAARGINKTSHGFIWKYADTVEQPKGETST